MIKTRRRPLNLFLQQKEVLLYTFPYDMIYNPQYPQTRTFCRNIKQLRKHISYVTSSVGFSSPDIILPVLAGKKLHLLSVKLSSLGIMGTQLRAPLNPFMR